MQSELVIIKLPYGLTKSRNILTKPYFINSTSIEDQQLIPNNLVLIQKSTFVETLQIQIPLIDISLMEISEVTTLLISSLALALIKQDCKPLKKYLK